MTQDTYDFLSHIKKAVTDKPLPTHKIGTVTVASPLQIAWVGETDSGAVWPKLDTYIPTVGDTVVALPHGPTWIVVGSANGTTGWTNLTLASGYQAFSATNVPQYLVQNRTVYFRGQIAPTSGTFAAGTASLTPALPSAVRPSTVTDYVMCVLPTSSNTIWVRGYIPTSTGVLAAGIGTAGAQYIDISPLSYPLA